MNSNKVIISKNSYNQIEAISLDGIDRTTEIPRERLREAFNKNKGLEKKITASGAIQWWLIDIEENLIMDSSDPIETSLEQSLIDIGEMTDERGLLIAAKGVKMIVPPENQFNAERLKSRFFVIW